MITLFTALSNVAQQASTAFIEKKEAILDYTKAFCQEDSEPTNPVTEFTCEIAAREPRPEQWPEVKETREPWRRSDKELEKATARSQVKTRKPQTIRAGYMGHKRGRHFNRSRKKD